jgi:hypothetical protein
MLAVGKPLVTKATVKNICRCCMYNATRSGEVWIHLLRTHNEWTRTLMNKEKNSMKKQLKENKEEKKENV